jgi:tripartite-type tricarboxylate transporter receptor subunit TctC
MKLLARFGALFGLASAATLAWADFPDKPITLVVPFAVGGPTDKIARDVAEALRKSIGQPVIVDNSAGAGGTIGAAKVAKATPDGYTLLVHHIGMATSSALYRNLTFKMPEDFEFLGLINEAPSVLIGRPDLEANNFADLRKWIMSSGGKVNLANAGLGSASHLCGLMFQSALATKLTPVPYKGTAPAMTRNSSKQRKNGGRRLSRMPASTQTESRCLVLEGPKGPRRTTAWRARYRAPHRPKEIANR